MDKHKDKLYNTHEKYLMLLCFLYNDLETMLEYLHISLEGKERNISCVLLVLYCVFTGETIF